MSWQPAGAQLWSKDVYDSGGTRAAYCSTLAMYIYDISETPRLEKILTGSSRTINAIAWNPHDPNSIAMTVSEDENNVLIWDLAAEALAKRLSAIGPAAKHVAWCAHSSARSRTRTARLT